MANININMEENRKFPPITSFTKQAHIKTQEEYNTLYQESIKNPEKFWENIADQFTWHKKWDRVLNWDNPPFVKWFENAKLNITENCIDRHLKDNKDKIAFYWEGEFGESQTLTYQDLHDKVCQCSHALQELGITKGDRVAIYLPMIPELAISVLACARIGAIHSVVFAGFSSVALSERIKDCQAKLVISSSGATRRGKILDLKGIVDDAVKDTSIEKCLIVKHSENPHNMNPNDIYWHDIVPQKPTTFKPVSMDAEDILFILYTSGSTGKPKGIYHTQAGYMIGTATTSKYLFDLKKDDIYWCTADVGWITGHSYIIYGPLANGISQVMYEGAPNYPDCDRFWDIVEKYKVSVFYTAPTAIRAFMKWGNEHVEKHDLSSLRLLGTVGEMINPEAWMWYHEKIGNEQCPIVDTWWQTETGGIMLSPMPGITATKPGCATIPFFGISPLIVNEKGEEVNNNEGGLLVITKPWPSMLRGIWNDQERFLEVYWKRFEKYNYYLAGDGAVKDDNDYITILGRIDDVINVSGHRLSTMELESVLVSHPLVVEAAVVGFHHEIKGEAIAAFVIPPSNTEYSDENLKTLEQYIVKEIGAFARPNLIRFTEALPKTRSGKIMRRLLKQIAANKEITGDISTLEDKSIIEKLQNK